MACPANSQLSTHDRLLAPTRHNPDRKTRSLVHQLEALGHKVTLQPAA
jgi:hypothetical protein